jgi:hypothetical protein
MNEIKEYIFKTQKLSEIQNSSSEEHSNDDKMYS